MSTMLSLPSGVRADEGIRTLPTPDGVLALATRVDTTRITITETGFVEAVAELASAGASFVVDSGLYAARADELRPVLRPDRTVILPSGEGRKTLETVGALVSALYEQGAHRRAPVVAVGGGATSDAVGLCAALYFRGVPAVYVPTTLLAMVDAAIGGKTGVNHPRQKNLIGTFTHPAEVRIRLDALATLPPAELLSAYGEILKIAVVDDAELFDLLETCSGLCPPAELRHVVHRCVEAKLRLLGSNAFERDLARALNLGHTVAHPLEDLSGFRIRHGTAVAIGIAVACHISHTRGLLADRPYGRILAVIGRLGLPVMDLDIVPDALIGRVQQLRLQRGGASLHYVLPTGIGTTTFTDTVTPAELAAAIADLRALQQEATS